MRRLAISLVLVTFVSGPALAQTVMVRAATVPAIDAAPLSPDLATDVSVPGLFRGLRDDVRQLASIENLFILGAGGALAAAVHGSDAQVTRRFVKSQALDTLFEPGTVAGGGIAQVGAAIGVYVLGRGTHSPRVSLLGADLLRSQIVNTALTQPIKIAVARQRPDGAPYSFPSGHTSSSFATATVLQRHLGWKVGGPAYAVAALIGGSRLQENRHYLSDVIFGAAIGLVSGRSATVGRGHARLAVAPFAAAGGGGVGFSLVPAR